MKSTSDFPELVDPADGRSLRAVAGGLTAGGETYRVTNGIPRLVPGKTSYADAFGDQWNRWRLTQLDSYTGVPISRMRLLRCLGDAVCNELADASRHIDVLEAGCGAGRFTEVLLSLPAVRLTSIDLSSAVDANHQNFPQDSRHRVVQCDICRPPFPEGSFEVVVCLGVIQHTPNPERTIDALYRLVRPGGWLVIDHYAPSWRHWTKVTALGLRPIVKRLPPAMRMRVCEVLTAAILPIHRAVRRLPLAQQAVSRLSPLLTYYHAHPELADRHQREWALLDTHDSLTDWYKHLRTPIQIRNILERLGACEVQIVAAGNGVEARCRRPV